MKVRWRGTAANEAALDALGDLQEDDFAQNTATGTVWHYTSADWVDTSATSIDLITADTKTLFFALQELSDVISWDVTYGVSDPVTVRKNQDQSYTIGGGAQTLTGIPTDLTAVDSTFNAARIRKV